MADLLISKAASCTIVANHSFLRPANESLGSGTARLHVPETRFEVRLGQQDDNMVGRMHLRDAPTTEAIVDIRVKARPDLNVTIFGEPHDMSAAGFPEKVEQRVFTTKVQLGPKSGSQSTEHDLRGYMFRSVPKRP